MRLVSATILILLICLSASASGGLSAGFEAFASGREIDIYTQYPAPEGGQGKNMPSDPFGPMMEVCLYAYVTYNLSPVEGLVVTFEIEHGEWHFLLYNVTDWNGKACVKFRVPWPDVDQEARVLGIWNVTATVGIASVVVTDVLWFYVSLTDLNCDGRVDIRDIAVVAFAFGSYPGHLRWNPAADIIIDEKVDVKDIARVAKDYGWSQ